MQSLIATNGQGTMSGPLTIEEFTFSVDKGKFTAGPRNICIMSMNGLDYYPNTAGITSLAHRVLLLSHPI